jgi:hypothetical protein
MAQQSGKVGCLGILAILVVIGLAIAYWYVVVPVVVVAIIAGLVVRSNNKKKAELAARHRLGPRDPWLNDIAVALAELGFNEYARNTGSQIGGVPIEGDIRLDAGRLSVVITLLATSELARQAEMAIRAKPEVRSAISSGQKMVQTEDLVLYVANGLNGAMVDDTRLREVIQTVEPIAISPPRPGAISSLARATTPPAPPSPPTSPQPTPSTVVSNNDVLDQIKRLAELHTAGALSDEEFESKKVELLRGL